MAPIIGTRGIDINIGTRSNDIIFGDLGWNPSLVAGRSRHVVRPWRGRRPSRRRGDDQLYGDFGSDSTGTARGGNDLIDGGSGNDELFGAFVMSSSRTGVVGGNDTLIGGAGHDILTGRSGADHRQDYGFLEGRRRQDRSDGVRICRFWRSDDPLQGRGSSGNFHVRFLEDRARRHQSRSAKRDRLPVVMRRLPAVTKNAPRINAARVLPGFAAASDDAC